ncbi:hypothetical protein EVAR_85709_1 [Eumeta japonica]|uniref:Uncharacterized protein n=1 Tax=Eumeta variegata TaxID=151549 RepID=A0A4C1Y114_EUMVA|nr:hypothetical protein EVAR_85709_1 [Eumeta japonica]
MQTQDGTCIALTRAATKNLKSVETSQMTSQTTLIASPSAAGRHMRVPTARDMLGRRLVKSSRHRMSQETVTGRFPSPPAGGG